MATDWVDKMRQTVQPHVPEPVLAVGLLQPAGTWGAAGARRAIPIAGSILQRRANKKSGGLAKNGAFSVKMAMLALTADKLYAFGAKVGRTYQPKEQLGVWSRGDLRISTEPGRLATKVVIDVVSTGDHYELEATTVGDGGFTDAFLVELNQVA